MSMTPLPLADGCTRVVSLPDGIWCEYRPLLETGRRELAARLGRLLQEGEPGWRQAEHLAREVVAAQVVYWNLRDAAGDPLPVGAAALAGLSDVAQGMLLARVTRFDDPAEALAEELDEARRLVQGIDLAWRHPQVANRECADCVVHVYDESTGERPLHRGEPIPRPPGTAAPCRLPHVGCPRGTPETSRALPDQLLRIWLFDRECRAVGRYPPDALVARHAVIIRAAESQADSSDQPQL